MVSITLGSFCFPLIEWPTFLCPFNSAFKEQLESHFRASINNSTFLLYTTLLLFFYIIITQLPINPFSDRLSGQIKYQCARCSLIPSFFLGSSSSSRLNFCIRQDGLSYAAVVNKPQILMVYNNKGLFVIYITHLL